jgi:hypothetical protein
MTLTCKQSFVLKGQNGQEATFSSPYVNDEKVLEFKHCSFFSGKVTLNEEKKAIELHNNKKKILLLLKGENESLFKEMREVRTSILLDLRDLTKRFQAGEEPIYAIEYGSERYPYLITTPSVLDNGLYSVKYGKSILYFLNEGAKKKGKKWTITSYEGMIEAVSKALQKADMSKHKQGLIGEDKYYSLSINTLVELM